MIHVVWEFHVKPDNASEFEREYSSTGVWARLFRKSTDYQETLLLRDSKASCRYIVIDKWNSRSSYDAFKKQFSKEYAAIDQVCEQLTEKEAEIGVLDVL